MISDLSRIIEQATSENPKVKEEAILQLGMILEKHSTVGGNSNYYESVLSPNLLTVSLDESQKQELIEELIKLIQSEKMTSSLIWALGKAKSAVALDQLLVLVCRQFYTLSEEALWQALIGVDNFLSVNRNDQLFISIDRLIREYNLLGSLKEIENSGSLRLKELIQSMLYKIHSYFGI